MSNTADIKFLVGNDNNGVEVFGSFQKTGNFISSGHVGSGHASYDEGAFVCWLLQHYSQEELRFVMIDPKYVQLTAYEGIPHLSWPVIHTPDEAKIAVARLLEEVDRRLEALARTNLDSIEEYNQQATSKWPRILLLITELADLMMTDGKYYESSFITLAQKSKVVGVHLYLATQRPSASVLTDAMLANISGRMVFAVNSDIDSIRLLDKPGAESITAQGQLTFTDLESGESTLVQAPLIPHDDISRTANGIKAQLTSN